MSSTFITPAVYADLSAAAYYSFWAPANKILPSELPLGWTKNSAYSPADTTTGVAALVSSGFSASTFVNSDTKSIVIAFEGTDFGGDLGQFASDAASDVVLGAGFGSSQLVKAALLYEEVKNDPAYAGYNISFTGHSLGGGIASVMAVWFNKQATIIDPAPFLPTAINAVYASAVYTGLALDGYADQDLSDFIGASVLGSGLPGVLSREHLVTSYYTQGEILNFVDHGLATVYGTNTPIAVGGTSNLNPGSVNPFATPLTLHSIQLAALLEMSSGIGNNSFQSDTFFLPTLLAQIFNTSLYSTSPTTNIPDFLTELLGASGRSIGSNGQATSSSAVAMFSADLAKLGYYGGAQPGVHYRIRGGAGNRQKPADGTAIDRQIWRLFGRLPASRLLDEANRQYLQRDRQRTGTVHVAADSGGRRLHRDARQHLHHRHADRLPDVCRKSQPADAAHRRPVAAIPASEHVGATLGRHHERADRAVFHLAQPLA